MYCAGGTTSKRIFVCGVRVLYGAFIFVSCNGKIEGGVCAWRVPSGDLLAAGVKAVLARRLKNEL